MKNFHKIVASLLICVLFTGCWDKADMEDRSYVITLGIDKYEPKEKEKIEDETENKFNLSLGIAGLSEMAENKKGGENDEKKAVEIAGQTISSAIKAADMYSSRRIYLGQLKTVVFGEEILKDKEVFKEALEALEKNQEVSTKAIILATEGKAVDYVNAILKENDSSGLFIWDFYKNIAENVATTGHLDLENVLVDLRSTGNTVIPRIKVEDEKTKLGGGALISEYTLCGIFKDLEERGYLWIKGRAEGAIVNVKKEEKTIPMWALKNSCKFEFKEEQGKIKTTLLIDVQGSVEGNTTGKDSLLDEKNIDDLEVLFAQEIRKEVENTVRLAQSQYHADVMQFSKELRKRNYTLYKKQEGKTDNQIFESMIIEPIVNVHIRSVGVIE